MARLAVIGPTHPYKGGIAQHTTTLARRLADHGHEVSLVSWSSQYPALLYPGELRVPQDAPEVPVHDDSTYPLAWYSPLSWSRTARALADRDAVALTVVTPAQALAYLPMVRRLRREGVRTVALFHNVEPHERLAFGRTLTRRLARAVDAVIAHSDSEASAARSFGADEIHWAPLPPSLPAARPEGRTVNPQPEESLRVLSFGIVRDYKGIDVLLEAAALVPNVHVRVVGEFWGGTGKYDALTSRLGITDRVELVDGYVPAAKVADEFVAADVAVLPYRSATASGAALLALDHDVPVLVSDVGDLSVVIGKGRFGDTFPAGDASALAASLRMASHAHALAEWDFELRQRDSSGETAWREYVGVAQLAFAVDGNTDNHRAQGGAL